MLFVGYNSLVSVPEIAEEDALLEVTRNILPELLASSDTTSAYDTGDNLSGVLANSQPNPALFLLVTHK